MAVRTPGVWGIDLGQCALKAIRLEMKDGQVIATAFEYIEHPKILSQPDADPDELTAEALSQFLARNNIRGDSVAISVPGQSGLARFVKLPPVDEKKIADIVKFEAKQQIPFPLDEVIWDFQRLNKGDIIDGMALETEIGLFAMKKDMVHRAINQYRKAGVEVHYVQMAPLALCNFVSYDLLNKSADQALEEGEESLECVVGLEIGTDNSNLIITNGGRIIWQRPIPIGGNHFTRALTKEMKLTFAKAEHLKRNAAKSPDLKKILSSLRQVLNDFVGEVQRSLGYFTNTHRNAQIQYMIGLGNAFRLPGLQKFLQEKLQLEVRKFQKLERATGEAVTAAPTFVENIMSFGVAYGLALQGLAQAKLQTNLLPQEIKTERLIRAKKPWMVAAAASLLFGMSVLAFASGMENKAIDNPEVEARFSELEKVLTASKKLDTDDAAEKAKLEAELLVLKQLAGGVTERFNWQTLHQYINMATPQPNGDRLVPFAEDATAVHETYFQRNNDAKKAFDLFEDLRLKGKNVDNPTMARKNEAFIKENLVQINVVGVNAMYSDNLDPYFEKLVEDNARLIGIEEAKMVKAFAESKAAEDKRGTIPKDGWVIEIRGYTYHKKGAFFVEHTFIENLKHPESMKTFDGKKVLTPEMEERVKKNIGFLTLYQIKTVKNPVVGYFDLVNKGVVRSLLKPKAAAGGVAMPGAKGDAMAPDAGGAGAEVMRDSWRPVGEMAIAALGEGGAAGGPMAVGGGGGGVIREGPRPMGPGPMEVGGKNVPTVAAEIPVPRTEFIVLLVWREPGVQPTAGSAAPAAPAAPAEPAAKN